MLDLNLPRLDRLTVWRYVRLKKPSLPMLVATGKRSPNDLSESSGVLMLYYERGLTLRGVGELMGVGESRVPQIDTLAVKHLRAVIWETTPTIGEAQMLGCEIAYAAS